MSMKEYYQIHSRASFIVLVTKQGYWSVSTYYVRLKDSFQQLAEPLVLSFFCGFPTMRTYCCVILLFTSAQYHSRVHHKLRFRMNYLSTSVWFLNQFSSHEAKWPQVCLVSKTVCSVYFETASFYRAEPCSPKVWETCVPKTAYA